MSAFYRRLYGDCFLQNAEKYGFDKSWLGKETVTMNGKKVTIIGFDDSDEIEKPVVVESGLRWFKGTVLNTLCRLKYENGSL